MLECLFPHESLTSRAISIHHQRSQLDKGVLEEAV